MDILVTGRHIQLDDKFKERAEEKLSTITKLKNRVQNIEVQVTGFENAKNPDERIKVEITLVSKGPVIRAEASAQDKADAFDAALLKLKGILRRAADRRKNHRGLRTQELIVEDFGDYSPVSDTKEADAKDAPKVRNVAGIEVQGDGPLAVREKTFDSAPLTLAQALDEMELVGHDFFLYVDAETKLPSVAYRRHGYTYGVLHLNVE
ncbi:MAG: ribosome-associated translation inhibitor RaiA [Propionibacteriaceae bacterium]|jgi:ribosomal subunit interface protein|nr:ribosome-associated translation inhibitor RaiA [Propionibacteriaceae bacterium]